MRHAYLSLTLWTALALSLEGCQYFRDLFGPILQRPQVTVKDIRITSVQVFEVKIKIKVLVQNPNNFTLEFSNLKYTMTLGTHKIAFGEYTEKFLLESEKNTVLEIPLSLSSFDAIQSLREAFRKNGKNPMQFGVAGSIDFHSSLGSMTIPFDHKQDVFH